jgi:hypothetical protein
MATSRSIAEQAASYEGLTHTPDSWGRSIVELALQAAAEEARKNGNADHVKIPAEMKVKFCDPKDQNCNGGHGGAQICITLGGREVCLIQLPVQWWRL